MADAERAARHSGVRISELTDVAAMDSAYALVDRIWRPDPSNPPITAELLRVFAKAGNYVAGAYDGPVLVGVTVGFFAAPAGAGLHSHVTGVAGSARRRSVGYALKLHQRAWALTRGITTITWTFDPLVRRNAYFNLAKLGAVASEYLPDFYGPMQDSINGGDETDRLLTRWELASPEAVSACGGRPRTVDPTALRAAGATESLAVDPSGEPRTAPGRAGPVSLAAVPPDIEALRAEHPELARRWRRALREVLGDALGSGARVTGFDREGWYVIDRSGSGGSTR
ncbi:GNAT family N-acetyltransferase [Pseudonocardia sp. MH-G8]|nr:GNAT family N-acetyltransferase [Pseudonocardia sp. MH-G8]